MKPLSKIVGESKFANKGVYQNKVFQYHPTRIMNTQIITSMDAFERMYPYFNFGLFAIHNERFFALLLNEIGTQVGLVKLSSFVQSFIQIDLNLLLEEVAACYAVKVVVAHNSRTNNTQPTEQDDYFTQVLQKECRDNQLVLQDHLIISEYGKYYSYADKGRLLNSFLHIQY